LREQCASVEFAFRSRSSARLHGLTALVAGGSLSVAAFRSGSLQRFVRRHLDSGTTDAVVAFSSAMAQYARGHCRAARLVDFVDVDSDKWRLYAARHAWPQSWIYRMEGNRLARFEEAIAREWDHSLFVSRREADLFRPRVPGRPVSWLPMGVDSEYFRPPPDGPPRPEAPTIVFTGTMDYFPNADGVRYFSDSILPSVRRRVPGVRFLIVGRNPTLEVRQLAAREGITVTGTVPDVRPHLASSWISVAPLRVARGVQSKVLEAMAMGLPVVGTSAAFEGIDAGPENGVRVLDPPDAFADTVVDLLRDPRLRQDLGSRARAFVEREHRWDRHGADLEALLLDLAARARAGA
jgi:sugar transferase (PEP-CTERM/EpsH1 system associated)